MKRIISTLTLLLIITSAFSQRKENDPKHEYHYKKLSDIETSEVKIEFSDAHSQLEFTKIKLKITNKTGDYILFKPSEVVFKNENGEFTVTGKDDIIRPFQTDSKVLTVKGGTGFHVKTLTIALKGFYKIPTKGTVQEAADFQLPASANDFTAGPFQCTLSKISKKTDATEVLFKCTYTGSEYGLLQPAKIVVKTEKGEEYATVKSTAKPSLLERGDKDSFTAKFEIPAKVVDMQFSTLHIVWKDTFSESSKSDLMISSLLNLELDPGMTDAKNK